MILYTSKRFDKKFIKLSSKLQKQFRERRDIFLDDPFHPILRNHTLHGERRGQWSINITGDWRVLYEFLDSNAIIFVDIDTHGNLYQ